VGRDGLVVRFVSGHLETAKTLLALGDAGRCALHTMPQGVLARAIAAQGRGRESIVTGIGVGTFVDPRVGAGTAVLPGAGPGLVAVEGRRLRYRVPRIDVALFLATGADASGNVYMDGASTITESREVARAARRNGGKVIASVAAVVPERPDRVFLPAAEVDAVVVNPGNEQAISFPQLRPLAMLLPGAVVDVGEAVEEVDFINHLLGITPRRGPVEEALARQAATLFARVARPGAYVNIGVGLPEEVGRLIHRGGLFPDVTFLVETGVFGGLPAPGVFFGAAIRPRRHLSSVQMFRFMEKYLDVTVLGFLQVGQGGDVNVSRRGPRAADFVGPGGFIDVTTAARTILFVGASRANARVEIAGGQLRVREPGKPKLVEKVDEITFRGEEALRRGQEVWYVTTEGTMHLTRRGLELVEVVPGADLDALLQGPAGVVLPVGGPPAEVSRPVLTGEGFHLAWQGAPAGPVHAVAG
jgi:propionate CoA-transferase